MTQDYSMAGESPFIDNIFKVIGTTNNYCVEFGATDGYRFSNTSPNFSWTGDEGNMIDI